MQRILVATAIGGALFVGAAAPAAATNNQHTSVASSVTVTVSCFRGPWEEVIWDRPNAVFIDSLVSLGYTFPEAHAIGERVCRDESTVDQPDRAIEVMREIIAQNPPRR